MTLDSYFVGSDKFYLVQSANNYHEIKLITSLPCSHSTLAVTTQLVNWLILKVFYGGTSMMWTPLVPSKVSIERYKGTFKSSPLLYNGKKG